MSARLDRLYPGAYISAGWADDIDYGVVQNQTERGWWVFWHGSCTATVAQDGPDVTIHEDLEHARLEAYTRASAYYASKETLA